jgi:hypothetical protein
MSLRRAVFVLPIACLAASCVLVVDDRGAHLAGTGEARAGSERPGGKDGGDADELRDKQHELEHTRMELELARMDAANGSLEAKEELADAERGLEEAQIALTAFRERERALQQDEAEQELDDARLRVELQRQELDEVIAQYKGDEYAASAKELVVYRERKRLELAERGVALQERKLSLLTEHELPAKDHVLARAVDQAREKRRQARAAVAHDGLEGRLEVLKLEHEVDGLEREVRELGGDPAAAGAGDKAGKKAKAKTPKKKKPPEKPDEPDEKETPPAPAAGRPSAGTGDGGH